MLHSDANPNKPHTGPLELVMLKELMDLTTGQPEISIGLVDGPVNGSHPDLAGTRIRELHTGGRGNGTGPASVHGTAIAKILCAGPGAPVPGICPRVSLVIHPLFDETSRHSNGLPTAEP